tara:strand:+ start:2288 stop:2683 length:396 start_codon:yes stop_codon:yes gene_type:complete
MKIIYLYEEFMRVPNNVEGQPIYIFDQDLQKNYQISDKVVEYRYFLAEQAGAIIYKGNTSRVINEINQKNPISSIISKKTFIPEYQNLFLQIQEIYALDLLPDYFLSTDKYLQPAKRFFQYWNKIKKSLKY